MLLGQRLASGGSSKEGGFDPRSRAQELGSLELYMEKLSKNKKSAELLNERLRELKVAQEALEQVKAALFEELGQYYEGDNCKSEKNLHRQESFKVLRALYDFIHQFHDKLPDIIPLNGSRKVESRSSTDINVKIRDEVAKIPISRGGGSFQYYLPRSNELYDFNLDLLDYLDPEEVKQFDPESKSFIGFEAVRKNEFFGGLSINISVLEDFPTDIKSTFGQTDMGKIGAYKIENFIDEVKKRSSNPGLLKGLEEFEQLIKQIRKEYHGRHLELQRVYVSQIKTRIRNLKDRVFERQIKSFAPKYYELYDAWKYEPNQKYKPIEWQELKRKHPKGYKLYFIPNGCRLVIAPEIRRSSFGGLRNPNYPDLTRAEEADDIDWLHSVSGIENFLLELVPSYKRTY